MFCVRDLYVEVNMFVTLSLSLKLQKTSDWMAEWLRHHSP